MLELSDYMESKEASVHNSIETNNTSNKINNTNKNSSSGNVEYVEVNNEIKMLNNKRSKSLEKDEIVVSLKNNSVTEGKVKRPETAPPYLTDGVISSTSSSTVGSDILNKEIRNENFHHKDNDDNNRNLSAIKAESEMKENSKCDINIVLDNQSQCSYTMTWHEHIYRKPPKKPTPYSIMDILQWGCKRKSPSPIEFVSNSSDKNNNSNRLYQNVEPSTLQHLLNLNLNSPPRSANNSSNNVCNSNNSNSRGLSSYAETSEDESNLSDQPLNLCVIKSRDSSPGFEHSNSIKTKKGS